MFGVGVVLLGDLPFGQRQWLHTVADEKARPFIKTDDRHLRVVGLGVQGEQLLHLGQETGI
jgi:hypothetical protein